ncbi:MAG: hypothetical protein K2Z25_03795 [Beijerinckiaceae bacterium]|nr:hypothetical protein [Beijerinckiaceae bacterium]
MTAAKPFAKPTRMLRDFSGQVAISIAASAVAAAFFALPDTILPLRSTPAEEPAAAVWSVPLTPDGKFAMRLDVEDATARLEGAAGPATPAALAMPLAIGWAAPAAPAAVAAASAPQQPRLVHVDLPPSRRATIVEAAGSQSKARSEPAGQPLVIAEVAAGDQVERPRPPGLIGRVVAEPAARAAGLVTGAASVVGAAGSWTVAQASNLLPRW